MEASLKELLLIGFFTLSCIASVTGIYILSLKTTKYLLFSFAAVLILNVQWLSDLGSVLIYNNYFLYLSSVIIFPSIIFAIFISYVFHGPSHAKQLIYRLLFVELIYFFTILMLSTLGVTPAFITINQMWFSNHIFSSLGLFLSFLTIGIIWPLVHNQKVNIPLVLKIIISFWSALIVDTLVFTLGAFWSSPSLISILQSSVIVRTIITLFITPLITFYMNFQLKQSNSDLTYFGWDDLFSPKQVSKKIAEDANKISELETARAELNKGQELLSLQNQKLIDQKRAILNVLEDINEEKEHVKNQAEDLLKFQSAVEQSDEMMVITNPEGIVLWANPAMTRITGFTFKEAVGKKAGVLWGKLMDKSWYQNLWTTIKEKKQQFKGEIINHKKTRERFYSSISIYPLLGDKGEVKFFVATQRDITKEKEIDLMKTDFISLASHQLRTPLSAIKWFLEMLLNGDLGSLTAKQTDILVNVNSSNERMISLVDSLLNISRIESGRISIDVEEIDLQKLVTDVVQEVSSIYEKKSQKIIFQPSKEAIKLNTDPGLFRQVVTNILTNACKYTKDHGEIKISLSGKAKEVELTISDDGYGIPREDQHRVFDRFFRATNITTKETEGTGLGLYLAKIIIETLHGRIWFNSKEGEGTTFFITIPFKGLKSKKGEVKLT